MPPPSIAKIGLVGDGVLPAGGAAGALRPGNGASDGADGIGAGSGEASDCGVGAGEGKENGSFMEIMRGGADAQWH